MARNWLCIVFVAIEIKWFKRFGAEVFFALTYIINKIRGRVPSDLYLFKMLYD